MSRSLTRTTRRPSRNGGDLGMGHYRSNLRDLEFNLFEVFRVQDALAADSEVDLDTIRGVLSELDSVATGPLAESFADADRNPPVFDPATHSVHCRSRSRTPTRCCGTASGGGCPCPPSWVATASRRPCSGRPPS